MECIECDVSYVVKVCIVGDSGVGKSSLAVRFTKDEFYTNLFPTLGAGFFSKALTSNKGQNYKFQIWDTAGQERYRSLVPLYYHGAAVILIVFDVTNRKSLVTGASHWLRELRRKGPKHAVYALVGNKADLGEDLREVSKEEGEKHAKEMGAFYLETSAKSGRHVEDLFTNLCLRLDDANLTLPCLPHRLDSCCSSSSNESENSAKSWLKEVGTKFSYKKRGIFPSRTLKFRLVDAELSVETKCCGT